MPTKKTACVIKKTIDGWIQFLCTVDENECDFQVYTNLTKKGYHGCTRLENGRCLSIAAQSVARERKMLNAENTD